MCDIGGSAPKMGKRPPKGGHPSGCRSPEKQLASASDPRKGGRGRFDGDFFNDLLKPGGMPDPVCRIAQIGLEPQRRLRCRHPAAQNHHHGRLGHLGDGSRWMFALDHAAKGITQPRRGPQIEPERRRHAQCERRFAPAAPSCDQRYAPQKQGRSQGGQEGGQGLFEKKHPLINTGNGSIS